VNAGGSLCGKRGFVGRWLTRYLRSRDGAGVGFKRQDAGSPAQSTVRPDWRKSIARTGLGRTSLNSSVCPRVRMLAEWGVNRAEIAGELLTSAG